VEESSAQSEGVGANSWDVAEGGDGEGRGPEAEQWGIGVEDAGVDRGGEQGLGSSNGVGVGGVSLTEQIGSGNVGHAGEVGGQVRSGAGSPGRAAAGDACSGSAASTRQPLPFGAAAHRLASDSEYRVRLLDDLQELRAFLIQVRLGILIEFRGAATGRPAGAEGFFDPGAVGDFD